MASKSFPVKGEAYTFGAALFARSNNQLKVSPTMASGDFRISLDGGSFSNLATLPVVEPGSSARIKIALSSDEMDADEVVITAIDAAGDEWHDAMWVIHTGAGEAIREAIGMSGAHWDDWIAQLPLAEDMATAGDFLVALGTQVVDGVITRNQYERIVLAALAGQTTGAEVGTPQFMGQDGVKTRINAQMGNGNRVSVALDGSE